MPRLVTAIRRWLYSDVNAERTFVQRLHRELTPETRVLDLGCGRDGPLMNGLPRGRAIGADPIAAAPNTVRALGEALPFRGDWFDLVYCSSVLEHLPDPQRVFDEVARVLRPEGLFLVLTPNRWDYVSIASTCIPNSWHGAIVERLSGRSAEDVFPTLYRANTPRQLRRLAQASGLDVEDCGRYRQHAHYLQRSAPLYLLGTLFEQAVQRPIPMLRPWIVAAFRRPSDCRPPAS